MAAAVQKSNVLNVMDKFTNCRLLYLKEQEWIILDFTPPQQWSEACLNYPMQIIPIRVIYSAEDRF